MSPPYKAASFILVTRPSLHVSDFSKALKSRNLTPFFEPMLCIDNVSFQMPRVEICSSDFASSDDETFNVLIFTSISGVRAFVAHDSFENANLTVPVYCVGARTAQEVKKNGFSNVYSADGNGRALLDSIMKDIRSKAVSSKAKFLYVCGEAVAFDVALALNQNGIECRMLITYRALPAKDFSIEFLNIIKSEYFLMAPFFSVRTAQRFSELVYKNGLENCFLKTKALCISQSVLECVQTISWADTYIADHPSQDSMLQRIDDLLK